MTSNDLSTVVDTANEVHRTARVGVIEGIPAERRPVGWLSNPRGHGSVQSRVLAPWR